MTCPHCQTWVREEEHRCSRCGRRVRSFFPVSTGATAHAYDVQVAERPAIAREQAPAQQVEERDGQQRLFTKPVNGPRVVAFDAYVQRPEPVPAAKAQLPRPKTAKRERTRSPQLALDLQSEAAAPKPSIMCNVAVAERSLRVRAAAIDLGWMALGVCIVVMIYRVCGGPLMMTKSTLPCLVTACATIPLLYKLLFALLDADSAGMKACGLRLVNFDGNPPSQDRRFLRAFGSILSLLAAGIGLLWSLVDEDALTWHDHISASFPTAAFD